MTIGKLLEILMSSLGLVRGEFVDATPFRSVNARWAINELLKSGYGAEETMVDGISGEVMARPWFIGSCFYQTLKHMVLDKITVRQRGQRAILTRQPLDGRANQGGQRFGEMEKDAFLAHGAAFSLDDRSRIASDAHNALVCSKCGQICDLKEESLISKAQGDKKSVKVKSEDECLLCGAANSMVLLPSTYCYSRLLIPEIATCGIKVKHFFSGGDIDQKNAETQPLSKNLYAEEDMVASDEENESNNEDMFDDEEYEQLLQVMKESTL
jgi:DNA-directed RNA polymerase beta subunit